MAEQNTGQMPARITITLQDLDDMSVEVPYDQADAAGHRVVSLDFGDRFGARVQFLDDIDRVAAVIHRADVLMQARLATGARS